MLFKRYEYWSKDGKKWSEWFPWNSTLCPELQMDDRRIFCRLKNEYKEKIIRTEEELLNNIKKI